jgi:ABC-type sugar transport system ATPase subunit
MSNAQRPPLLEAVGMFKRFGSVRDLEDASLSVAAGEVRGLFSAEGDGKSKSSSPANAGDPVNTAARD